MPTPGTRDVGGNTGDAISVDARTVISRANDARGFENAAIWQGGENSQSLGSITPNAQPCDNVLSGSFVVRF